MSDYDLMPPCGCIVVLLIFAVLGLWKFVELLMWLARHIQWGVS